MFGKPLPHPSGTSSRGVFYVVEFKRVGERVPKHEH